MEPGLSRFVFIIAFIGIITVSGCLRQQDINSHPDVPRTEEQSSNPFISGPPELISCLKQALGEEAYNDIASHKRPPSSKEETSIDSCFKQFDKSAQEGAKKQEPDMQRTGEKSGRLYEAYPDTDAAPVLEFFWGPPELDTGTITRVTPYGAWEDWKDSQGGVLYEPAVEMQFYATAGRVPVYAAASGTVITVERGYKTDSGFTSGGMTASYGRNYGITYHHLVDIPDNIKPGTKIEAETLIGYGEVRPAPDNPSQTETWWEIELN